MQKGVPCLDIKHFDKAIGLIKRRFHEDLDIFNIAVVLNMMDVNSDGSVNASDAAIILQYAAYIGAGNPEMTLAEYMLNK